MLTLIGAVNLFYLESEKDLLQKLNTHNDRDRHRET